MHQAGSIPSKRIGKGRTCKERRPRNTPPEPKNPTPLLLPERASDRYNTEGLEMTAGLLLFLVPRTKTNNDHPPEKRETSHHCMHACWHVKSVLAKGLGTDRHPTAAPHVRYSGMATDTRDESRQSSQASKTRPTVHARHSRRDSTITQHICLQPPRATILALPMHTDALHVPFFN